MLRYQQFPTHDMSHSLISVFSCSLCPLGNDVPQNVPRSEWLKDTHTHTHVGSNLLYATLGEGGTVVQSLALSPPSKMAVGSNLLVLSLQILPLSVCVSSKCRSLLTRFKHMYCRSG